MRQDSGHYPVPRPDSTTPVTCQSKPSGHLVFYPSGVPSRWGVVEIRARPWREQGRLDRELERLLDGPEPARKQEMAPEPKRDAASTVRRQFSLNQALHDPCYPPHPIGPP